MILSAQQLFSSNQAITATAISTNVIDLGVAGTPFGAASALNMDVGKGTEIPLLIQVTEAFNTLTSLTITIEVGSTTALGTAVVSTTILLANLKAGKQAAMVCLPKDINARYLGVRYTVAGTNPTAGKITAGITMGVQTNVTGA
tara:strand:- start:10626 stop:11057 length:432 start_codon:yes stop_codon:yes gene_type:complete